MTLNDRPQDLVERALQESTADHCIVLVWVWTSANLRWANNTLTTNGLMSGTRATVVSCAAVRDTLAPGVASGSFGDIDQLLALVAQADAAADAAAPAEDANPLIEGSPSTDWDSGPGATSISVFEDFAPALGDAFGRAKSDQRILYGFAEHDVTTVYLGSTSGLRLRHEQPTGHLGVTGKAADLGSSAWVGSATRDFKEMDATALYAELSRRLRWAGRNTSLKAGRYDTVLPPAAVADLQIYAYWSAAAREADDGRSVYSKRGGGTRIGEQLASGGVHVFSDPSTVGLECEPFVVAQSSSSASSVFDNGAPLTRTAWIRDGRLEALQQTRHSARETGLDFTPGVNNLSLEVDGALGSVEDLVAQVEYGLLLTCLWYIRAVDDQTLLLTGLTRDGVYLIENGEVSGAVNNFRFNESPIDLLNRFSAASATVPSLSREWGDYFPRTAMPALRVPDFNMSTVSQAS
jgi:predicted Zn-dependent protease